jgi:hypothetical protein
MRSSGQGDKRNLYYPFWEILLKPASPLQLLVYLLEVSGLEGGISRVRITPPSLLSIVLSI